MTRAEQMAEAAARRAAMTKSSIAFTLDPTGEYNPISKNPLSQEHLKSRSANQYKRQQRVATASGDYARPRSRTDPASSFIATKYIGRPASSDVPEWAGTQGCNIVLGSDDDSGRFYTSASATGKWQAKPPAPLNLLEPREKIVDKTMDGEHAASLSEAHFLTVHYPFMTDKPKAAASFKSGLMLRDNHRRHTRSAYNPDEKYVFPPSEMNEIGWKISDKYDRACAKFADGAPWHGRQGSHITKFSERLLLGARHAVSGPLAPRAMHY